MQKLLRYIKPYWLAIVFALTLKFLGTYAELQIPKMMQVILDEKVPSGETAQIFLYGGLMLLFALLGCVLNIVSNRRTSFTAGKIMKKLRHDLYDKLQRLSPRQMDGVTVSSAVSRLTSDTKGKNNFKNKKQ